MLLRVFFISMLCLISSADLYKKQLIVLSLPDNYYYTNIIDEIAAFAKDVASKASGYDDVLVLFPSSFTATKSFDLGSARCLKVDEPIDLWVRDFGIVNPTYPVKFRYAPEYLTKGNSSWVDQSFRTFLHRHVLSFETSQIALDGGNVVDNGIDKAIITKRTFEENQDSSEESVRAHTKAALGMQVAYIPDPKDTTGHSDGIVSFVEKDTVMIADFSDDYFYNQVDSIIKNTFPDVKTVKLPCPDVKNSNWRKFRSAFGAYANALVTDSTVYMPSFGRQQHDANALNIIRQHSDRRVVAIDTSQLAHMGGNVRCMSMQIDADHPIAKALYQGSVPCIDV